MDPATILKSEKCGILYNRASSRIVYTIELKSEIDSHSTMRVMRLLTEGGILLLAMQRYAPICSREMSCKSIHICDMSCKSILCVIYAYMQYNFQYVVWRDKICSHKRQKKRDEMNLQIEIFSAVDGALDRPWLCLVRVSKDWSPILPAPGYIRLRHLAQTLFLPGANLDN